VELWQQHSSSNLILECHHMLLQSG